MSESTIVAVRDIQFLFIVGHPSSDVGDTLIDINNDLPSALRRYNTSARGVRAAKDGGPGQLCAAIMLPHWRTISARDLLRLWRSSRKLYCRVRFGIWIAHALQLVCVVDRALLTRIAARKALPHVAARLPANELDCDAASTSSASQRRRRRGRRPSTSDVEVAQHAQLLSLAPCDIDATLTQLLLNMPSEPARHLKGDALDLLNTLCHKKNDLCFTTGRVRNVAPKRAARVPLCEQSGRIAARAATLRAIARGSSDADDDHNNEAEQRDTTAMSDAVLCALETVMYCADARVAAHATQTLMHRLKRVAGAKRKLCDATVVRAADVALIDCGSDRGKIDNELLVQHADACYNNANEYQRRRLARVKVHRAGICYCGSANSFGRTVRVRDWKRGSGSPRRARECSVCRRNTLQFRLFRTDVAQLKEDATSIRPNLSDRRALRALMLSVERDSDIERYARDARSEAEDVLQLRKRARVQTRRGSVATERRKEAPLIDAALRRLILEEE